MCWTDKCKYESLHTGQCTLPWGDIQEDDWPPCMQAVTVQELLFKLDRLEKEALAALEQVKDSKDLANWRRRYITGKGDTG